MADREQFDTEKRGMEQKPQRNTASTAGQTHPGQAGPGQDTQHRVKPDRDMPDESKEHHTEIAVEAGHRDGEHHGNKR